eukprot:TRINITY_DN1020_c1_g1_i1.p1 TRINITY_DN1020_c1_g1~~TRINITY_DN1020_c1_g1_i1.p1  ORF type:complete len:118 (+),score=12.04 TRINITY_DN1020_c1_g1_i1:220-573(+)
MMTLLLLLRMKVVVVVLTFIALSYAEDCKDILCDVPPQGCRLLQQKAKNCCRYSCSSCELYPSCDRCTLDPRCKFCGDSCVGLTAGCETDVIAYRGTCPGSEPVKTQESGMVTMFDS